MAESTTGRASTIEDHSNPRAVLATSIIRSQKTLFLLVLSQCHQMNSYEIGALAYKTSIYFFQSYAGITHFFRS